MWTKEHVDRLTKNTAEGSLKWTRSSDRTHQADHEGERLTLEQADDERTTLMSDTHGTVQDDHPEIGSALRALWGAIA